MLTQKNVKTISDMREDPKGLLDQAKKHGPTYIFYRSQPKGVLLSLKEYNRLCDMAEDYADSLKAQEQRSPNPKSNGALIRTCSRNYTGRHEL